jgi:hypothetical protein
MMDKILTDNRRLIYLLLVLLAIVAVSIYLGMTTSFALLVIAAIIAINILIRRQYLLVAGIILIFSILPITLGIGGLTEIQIYFLIIPLFLWMILDSTTRRNTHRKTYTNFFLVLFLLITIVNYFRNPGLPNVLTGLNPDNQISFSYLMENLTLLCGYLIMPLLIENRKQIKTILRFLAVFFAVGLFFAWLGFLFNVQSPFVPGYAGTLFTLDTTFGTVTRYGWIGNYAIYLLPFALVLIPRNKRILKWAAVIFLLTSVIFSGGRGQLIEFVVTIILYLVLERLSLLPVFSIGLILAFGIFALSETNLIKSIPQLDRFSISYASQQVQTTAGGLSDSRLGVISLSLDMIKKEPLIGMGPPTRNEIRTLQKYPNDAYFEAREGSHSTYFNIPAVYGIPAMILFIIGIFITTYRTYIAYKYSSDKQIYIFLLVMLFGYLVVYLFSGRANGGSLYFYMTLGFMDTVVGWQPGDRPFLTGDRDDKLRV